MSSAQENRTVEPRAADEPKRYETLRNWIIFLAGFGALLAVGVWYNG